MDRLLEECESYDIENDTEAYGRSLAERCFQKYGTFKIKDIIQEQRKWKRLKSIAFKEFAPLLVGETILTREIKTRLRELKHAGYEIESGYSKLKKKHAWAYFRKIKRDISAHLNNPAFG